MRIRCSICDDSFAKLYIVLSALVGRSTAIKQFLSFGSLGSTSMLLWTQLAQS